MPLRRPELFAFRIAGFRIRFDPTWLILALLISVTLTFSVFPSLYEGLSPRAYALMALVALFGLTFSIILHELGHSLVARRAGLPIEQVTLFMFGGAAELEAEPESARLELVMALAGPAVSIVIGAVLLGVYALSGGADGTFGPLAVLHYLGLLNLALAVFNLIPCFPLDGGRVLRALLWLWGGDRYKATRRAVQISQGFTLGLMILGVLAALGGAVGAGVWWVLIALFIRGAVFGAWREAQARQFLSRMTVRDFMAREPIAADAGMTVAAFLERRLYPYHHALFPVLERGRVIGAAGAKEVAGVAQKDRPRRTLGEIASPLGEDGVAAPSENAAAALARMTRAGVQTLVVLENGQLAGVLGAKDVLDYLRLRALLED